MALIVNMLNPKLEIQQSLCFKTPHHTHEVVLYGRWSYVKLE